MLGNVDLLTPEGLMEGIATEVSGGSNFKRFQRMYKNDRVAFVHDCFPEYSKTVAFYQDEILGYFDSGCKRVAVRGPHGLGKTWLASVIVHHTILTAEEDCKVPMTASAWRQLEKYLLPEIRKGASKLDWSIVGRKPYIQSAGGREELHQNSITLNSGLIEAFAMASDNFALIEGAHATIMMYVFDEAKTIPDGMWDAAEGAFATENLIPDSQIRAFAISTPGDPTGRFFDIHSHKPGYEDWKTRHVTVDEAIKAGRVAYSWVKQREKQWGLTSSVFQNRVLGEFADNSEEGVIPLSWVEMSMRRWQEWSKAGKPEQDGKKTMGVDVARMGEDKTVFAMRQASVITSIHAYSKLSTTATAGNIRAMCSGKLIHIEMDGGLGAAVYDMLREQNTPLLRPIIVGAKTFMRDRSKELQFANVRSAMWWNLRELLDPDSPEEPIMLPPNDLLKGDLVTPTWKMMSNGTIQVEPKDEIAKRINRSTDYGDAVCLAFWKTSGGGGVMF
jgi:hypothetical protein